MAHSRPNGVARGIDAVKNRIRNLEFLMQFGRRETFLLALQSREPSGDELIPRPYNDGHDGLGCALAAKLDRGPFVIRCAGNDKVIAAQREGDLILALRLRLVRGIIRRYDRPLGHLRRLVV